MTHRLTALIHPWKCTSRAPIFGTEQSLGTLILWISGQSQKTTRVGWFKKSFILPIWDCTQIRRILGNVSERRNNGRSPVMSMRPLCASNNSPRPYHLTYSTTHFLSCITNIIYRTLVTMVATLNRLKRSSLGSMMMCMCLYISLTTISPHYLTSSLQLPQNENSSHWEVSLQGSSGSSQKYVQASNTTTKTALVGDNNTRIEEESESESEKDDDDHEEEPPLVKSRIFRSWPQNQSLPCYHPTDGDMTLHWTQKKEVLKKPASQGLFYLKLLKAASSTASSIHLRIAKNLAKRRKQTTRNNTHPEDGNFEICKTRHLHGFAHRMYKFHKRIRKESYLWTLLREPNKRYISEFFHFEVSRLGVKPTDANVIQFLRTGKHSDRHYLSWLTTAPYSKRQLANPFPVVQKILQDYDFIGITERLD